jgi:hypothetical protein
VNRMAMTPNAAVDAPLQLVVRRHLENRASSRQGFSSQ